MEAVKLLTYLFLIQPLFSSAQNTFQKTYGSVGYESAEKIIELYDSSYLVVGSSVTVGSSSDVYLLKVDSLGNYLWSKFYGGPGIDDGMDVIQTLDSGFAVAGFTNSYGNGGYDGYLIKLDKNGNIEWEKTFGGSDWDFLYAIEQRSDSGFIMVGETYSFGEGNNDIYIIRTDQFGNTLWEKTLGTTAEEKGIDFILTTFESIILTAEISEASNEKRIYTARLTPAGDTVWTKTYPSDTSVFPTAMEVLTQFNYYNIVGVKKSLTDGTDNMYLMGINGNGDTVYTKEFITPDDIRITGLAIRNPVDQMFSAHISSSNAGNNMLGYYANYFGIPLQTFVLGTAGEDLGESVAYTYDDGFILCGTTEQLGLGATDIYLVKLGPSPGFVYSTNIDDQYMDVTAVNTPELSDDLKIYPNPARDHITIDFTFSGGHYEIYMPDGKIIIRGELTSMISIENLANGLYFLRIIKDDGTIYSVRILKRG